MNKRIRKKKAKQQLIRAISGLVEAAEEMQREQERRTRQAGISYIKYIEASVQIKAEELLQQRVDSMNHADGTWYVLTRLYEPEAIPARTSEEGMVCHV